MDFIVGLPLCHGKLVILVVVDRLTEYPYTDTLVAQLFLDNVFKLHGKPSTIVSDKDPIFLSAFWKEFFKLQGSKLCMSLGYHPQSGRQIEVVNRCLETFLKSFAGN